jgi:hypothetical protein
MGGSRVASLILALLLASAAHANAQQPSSPGDMAIVKQRLTASMLASSAKQQAAAVKAAETLANQLLPNGTFPDIDYHEFRRAGWPMVAHLGRVTTMAAAWRGSNGSSSASLAPLLANTMSALDVWLTNDWKNPNWYDNEIGVPRQMGNIGLLLQPALSAADATKMTEIMARADWKGSGTVKDPKWTGANLLDMLKIQIHRGVFANDSSVVAQGFCRSFEAVVTSQAIKKVYDHTFFSEIGCL